jgi:hypothetical protein
MGKVGKKFILLLNIDKVLATPELRAAETAAAGTTGAGLAAEDGSSPAAETEGS